MPVTKKQFGTTPKGDIVELYSLENSNGLRADIMTYGANIVNLYVPDENGEKVDVALGYDKLEDYFVNNPNFGATIGPNCNRIGGAAFDFNGKKIQLSQNDGVNNLHTDAEKSLQKKLWKAQVTDNSVIMTTTSPEGETPFPGNKTFRLTFTLDEDNTLTLHYEASADCDTIINLTNHAYFNLSGHGAGEINDHILWLKAQNYTVLLPGGIPNGEIAPVEGTALDFTKAKRIGRDIDGDDPQTRLVGGYDQNFVIDDYDGSLRKILELNDPASGRNMDMYTNLPGIQVYSGNFIASHTGKDGVNYEPRMGIAFEPQFFPDTPHHGNFPSTVFGPDRKYDYTTVYHFF